MIFNAFSLPLDKVHYILWGESPYPRANSANGYAFWDAAVDKLWSATGLATAVNRATSLRNFIKMLLVADGALTQTNTSQTAIAELNKNNYIQTNHALFTRLQQHGFLLLNASLVLHDQHKQKEARLWLPFMQSLLSNLHQQRPQLQLLLFGKIAQTLQQIPICQAFSSLQAEHPYNLSFIQNQVILDFFRPFKLLTRATDHAICEH